MKYLSIILTAFILTACATTPRTPTAAELALQQVKEAREEEYRQQFHTESFTSTRNKTSGLGTTSPGYWKWPERADLNLEKDDLECQAMAGQAAQGAGGWTSVAPVGAAFYDHAKQQYYNQCLQSRGYTWIPPR